MRILNWVFITLFIVRVTIPWGTNKIYTAVSVYPNGYYYQLELQDGTIVYVPTMFTVIDEIKEKTK